MKHGKKYISNYHNNFFCVSITFTNIYLTYKKGNYYVYKIYEDDYSAQHRPDSRSQCSVCPPLPPPSEGLLTHSGAPGGGVGGRVLDTVEADVQINTWHVSTVGIYWQTQTRSRQY